MSRTTVFRFVATALLTNDPVRLTEFELDTDELDEETLSRVQGDLQSPTRNRHANGDQSMPLLVGLVDASAARSSLDLAESHTDIDLEELAGKRIAGGSMVDSVANMANSILGAGEDAFNSWQTPSSSSITAQVLLAFHTPLVKLASLLEFSCSSFFVG